MRTIWLWCVVWMSVLVACDEEDSSPLVILVSPGQQTLEVKAGDKVIYTVEAFSNGEVIEHIRISSKDAQRGLVSLLDSNLNVPKARFDFQYIVPVLEKDSVRVDLTFEAKSSQNYTLSTRSLHVLGGEMLLEEESGYTLYSATSSKADAFRLSDSQLLFSKQEEITALDIYDYHDEQVTLDKLACEWRSGAGIKFVRFNDFNYPQATEFSIKSAYQAGVKYSAVQNMSANDILLVGKDGEALGAIKIVNVFDEDGTANDRYIFNLKKIGRQRKGDKEPVASQKK